MCTYITGSHLGFQRATSVTQPTTSVVFGTSNSVENINHAENDAHFAAMFGGAVSNSTNVSKTVPKIKLQSEDEAMLAMNWRQRVTEVKH